MSAPDTPRPNTPNSRLKPPKPAARPAKTTLFNYLKLFRKDILSAQPEKLYRAWMAEFKTPFFRSFMVNQPDLVKTVLKDRPLDFPKSSRIAEGLRPLLGDSVFLTNGETWLRQRRIIDPAFEGGRLKDTFPAMLAAGEAAVTRFGAAMVQASDGAEGLAGAQVGALGGAMAGDAFDVEPHTSHAAADVIFRTLFSIPITHDTAAAVFSEFQAHQRAQPILNLAAFIPLPKWVPRFHSRETKRTAKLIRGLIAQLTSERMAQIEAGDAPDDLATKIMTTADPKTGEKFDTAEMIDQVAIFFLAGHETSASALAWALWLMAEYPEVQEKVATEGRAFMEDPSFRNLSKLRYTKDVFREALRLYPPVPMMVREASCPETFRDRTVPKGAQIVLSPWHLHRHERFWDAPDDFDPDRYQTENGKACLRDAYIPFSAGARVCTGAGFAMVEGPLFMAMLAQRYHLRTDDTRRPVPVAHLTVRAKDGIWLRGSPRD